jgi:hypothetical protein
MSIYSPTPRIVVGRRPLTSSMYHHGLGAAAQETWTTFEARTGRRLSEEGFYADRLADYKDLAGAWVQLTGIVVDVSEGDRGLVLAVPAGHRTAKVRIIFRRGSRPEPPYSTSRTSVWMPMAPRLVNGQMLVIDSAEINRDGHLVCFREQIEIVHQPAGTISRSCLDDLDWTMSVDGEPLPNRGTLAFDEWVQVPTERGDVYARALVKLTDTHTLTPVLLSEGHVAVLLGFENTALACVDRKLPSVVADGFLRHDGVFVVDDVPRRAWNTTESSHLDVGGFARLRPDGDVAIEYLPGSEIVVARRQDNNEIEDGDLVTAQLRAHDLGTWISTDGRVHPFAAAAA